MAVEVSKSGKKYGLSIPKKKGSCVITKPSVFDEDSDDNAEVGPVGAALLQKKKYDSKVKMQTQLEIDRALADDPSCYEYDSLYDSMQQEKKQSNVRLANKSDRKPRYISGLMKAAEARKREDERRVERTVQKERENEGDEFADKESFVTTAYKKKMEEMQEEEEKGQREAQREALLDVTKQKDLSGFYRYLYKETTTVPTTSSDTAGIAEPDQSQDAAEELRSDDLSRQRCSDTKDDEHTVDRCDSSSSKHRHKKHKNRSRTPERRSRYRSRSRSPKRNDRDNYKRKQRHSGSRSPDDDRSHPRSNNDRENTPKITIGGKFGADPDNKATDDSKSKDPTDKTESQPSYSRKTSESAVEEARARYLARKAGCCNVVPVTSHGDSD